MDNAAPLKFYSASEATWVDIGGRYLTLRERDIEDLRQAVSGPEIRLQDLPLTHEQAHAILGYFS